MQFSINPNKSNPTTDKNSKGIKSDGSSKIKDKENSFLSILESIAPSDKEQTREINELWQRLPDMEKRFLAAPSQDNLNEYKKLVKDITNTILKNNTQLTQARQRGRNDKKILMTVKVLDENIQILASTMLSPHNSAFSLLKQIERIRGLLMDLKE
ncbi:MAG: DUF327 family protein [Leptospiraceae bacterium]|nr:DUF327 family protein [Leptospiraceae bacterium]